MIIFNKNIIQIPRKITINLRFCTTNNEAKKRSNSITPNFLSKLLGTSHKKCSVILEEHKELYNVSQKEITNSFETLKSFNYDLNEINKKPMILYVNSVTLENRYKVLNECGCNPISLPILFKYITVMNKDISMLKSHSVIPFDVNVQERLEKNLTDNDIEIKLTETINENIPIKNLREMLLNCYLTKKLNMTKIDLDKQWKVYPRIRHKSFKTIIEMINLLLNELKFPPERIIKNGYLIYGDPDSTKKVLKNIQKIGNDDIKEILYRRPKIIMTTYESILQTIENIKLFNIPETSITKCLEVLTLGPETVLERLKDLKDVEEFQVLASNPRILRLVHYQNKARLRLDYLNQIKVRCASLHILSCDSDSFVKFARDGLDRTKGRDVVIYVSKKFNKSENEIREFISRHPNWCHIPVVQVKQCMDALIKKRFKPIDIYNNLHILLYPIIRIEEKLKILEQNEIYDEIKIDRNSRIVTKSELLNLCLYLIEFEFHFTGDGIWTEQHIQHVENFNVLLPDFTEKFQKCYKYGTKPAENKNKQLLLT